MNSTHLLNQVRSIMVIGHTPPIEMDMSSSFQLYECNWPANPTHEQYLELIRNGTFFSLTYFLLQYLKEGMNNPTNADIVKEAILEGMTFTKIDNIIYITEPTHATHSP
jgi:hypothetical protein